MYTLLFSFFLFSTFFLFWTLLRGLEVFALIPRQYRRLDDDDDDDDDYILR